MGSNRNRIKISPRIRDISIALLLGILITYGLHSRFENALLRSIQYQNAQICENQNCRQILDGKVIYGRTVRKLFEVSGKWGTKVSMDFQYELKVSLNKGKVYDSYLLPFQSQNSENLYPLSTFVSVDNGFVDRLFPVDAQIQVETWEEKPVLYITKNKNLSIINSYSIPLTELFNEMDVLSEDESIPPGSYIISPAPETTDNSSNDDLITIAVLTKNHPVWEYEQIKDSLTSSYVGVWGIISVFILFRYIFSSR